MLPADQKLQTKIEKFFEDLFPSRDNLHIHELQRITTGWETELYSFCISYKETGDDMYENLIIRAFPGENALEKAEKEYNFMRKLKSVNFPVPHAFHLERDTSLFNKPFLVMEKIIGRTMMDIIRESSPREQMNLISRFSKIFVDLHQVEWREFVKDLSKVDEEDPYWYIRHFLSKMEDKTQHLEKLGLLRILDWLNAHSSDVLCHQLSVTHGDYHPENILLKDDGEAFVIDWGAASVADSREDIGWTLLLMKTYGYSQVTEGLLNEYERFSGYKIEQIEYFEVLSIMRRLYDMKLSIEDGADALGMRPGAEEMMKQDHLHYKQVLALLKDRTGISLPEIESLIASWSK